MLRGNRSSNKPQKPCGGKIPSVAGQVLAIAAHDEEHVVYECQIYHEEDKEEEEEISDDLVNWTACEPCDIWYHDKCQFNVPIVPTVNRNCENLETYFMLLLVKRIDCWILNMFI